MRKLLLLAPAVLAGCVSDGDPARIPAAPLATREVSAATTGLAAKVDQIGAELVARSPFLGVTPTFAVVGRPGLEISHPDLNGVFVSEGLAARCSDDELAAVLALELGRMSAEAKHAEQLTRREPMPAVPTGGAAQPGADPNQLMAQALVDKHAAGAGRKPAAPVDSARSIAERVLADSGRDVALLAAAEPLHAEASRAATGPGVTANASKPPRWTN